MSPPHHLSPSVKKGGLTSSSEDPGEPRYPTHYLQSCIQLQATLCVNWLSLPLLALVDSGAEGNFLDEELTLQDSITRKPLHNPLNANALDGSLLAQATHSAEPLHLLLSWNHQVLT